MDKKKRYINYVSEQIIKNNDIVNYTSVIEILDWIMSHHEFIEMLLYVNRGETIFTNKSRLNKAIKLYHEVLNRFERKYGLNKDEVNTILNQIRLSVECRYFEGDR